MVADILGSFTVSQFDVPPTSKNPFLGRLANGKTLNCPDNLNSVGVTIH